MKHSKVTVALLCVNLGLLLAIAYMVKTQRAGASAASARPESTRALGSNPAQGPKVVRIVKTNSFAWTQLESEDYRTYIERLRVIGCPEQTIRDIVIADVNKLLAPQLHAVHGLTNELKYWQPDTKELETTASFRERQRQERQIDWQKREVIRELLGLDLVAERQRVEGQVDFVGHRLGFLPDEKRHQVRMLIEQSNDEEVALREKVWQDGEALTPDEQTRLKKLASDRESAIAALLTPDELHQYELTMSPLAFQVRDSFFGLNPTEQEFLNVFRLQKQFEQAWPEGEPSPNDVERRLKWEEARQALGTQLKQTLGEQRFAEYERAQDPDYRQLHIAAVQNGVADSVTTEVYGYKQLLQGRRLEVMTSDQLSLEQKRELMRAIADETERSVRSALGDRAYRQYVRSGAGAWIRGGPEPQ